ncbi:hypothetical protein [Piscinibacter gummiphilus]|uniref:Uncharacterized protein n=1 Tax=Piscinibacter gummiphilus TaxID=946333 RepID=A0ABZ0D0N6_9BURK|nr:hypothetical protein [Piscinibacter gummiphilus]WOB10759.1 hypothetical protein RXV79_12045 [Piscinibacter gummiphilus]
MSTFLELQEGSPARDLMAAIVQAGDALQEHSALLPPVFAEAMFNALCASAALVLQAHACSERYTEAAIEAARHPGRRGHG